MREHITKPTQRDIIKYLESVEPKRRQEDALNLIDLMQKWTGMKPVAWGGGLAGKSGHSIIGFGYYTDKNGNEWMLTGFSPRKPHMSIYIMPGYDTFKDQLARIGKHKHTVSCLYLTNMSQNDMSALEEMVKGSVEIMKNKYEWRPS